MCNDVLRCGRAEGLRMGELRRGVLGCGLRLLRQAGHKLAGP